MDDELFFQSHNDASQTTLVMLHGLFSCHLEWEHVAPLLPEYHLIIPDLPHHSKSKGIQPFSFDLAADKVAALIKQHAHEGKAHVIGLSLGGFVTQHLIRRHPDVVLSAFTTGAAPLGPWQVWVAARPSIVHWGFWLAIKSGIYKLAAYQTNLKPHEKLVEEIMGNNTIEVTTAAYADVARWQEEALKEVGEKDKRILFAAGGHGDNIEATKKAVEIFREFGRVDGKKTRAVVVDGAIHGWNLQFPELFAEGIKAWVEEKPLPEGFSEITSEQK